MMKNQQFLETRRPYSTINSDQSQLEKKTKAILAKTHELCSKLDVGSLTFSYGNRPVRALPTDIVRVLSEWDQNDLSDLTMRNIILNTILSLEIKAAYSGYAFLKSLKDSSVVSYRKRSDLKDIDILVKKHLGSGICSEIVSTIFKSSPNASINFTLVDDKPQFSVKISESLLASGSIPKLFEEKINSLKDAWPVVIDGYVERVSEIHRLLETASENNQKVLIIARKFSPDVVSTLNQNYKSKKLNVVPFETDQMPYIKEALSSDNVVVIDSENSIEINSLSSDDLLESKTVVFDKLGVNFVGTKSIDRHVTVEIPKHFHKLAGLIEDRIKSGLCFCQDIAKYGVALDEENTPVFGLKQYREALRSVRTFNNFFENLGCVVIVE